MNETFARWDAAEELVHHPEDAAMYLEACIDEDPGDGSVIRAALNDIARAQGMSGLAPRRRVEQGKHLQGVIREWQSFVQHRTQNHEGIEAKVACRNRIVW